MPQFLQNSIEKKTSVYLHIKLEENLYESPITALYQMEP